MNNLWRQTETKMKRILIQFDTDPHPSTFDGVVAIDAGVDQLFSYGNVTPETVTNLVHGAMFTRGPDDLKHTALFIGGSDVEAGEELLAHVAKTFFGPVRVSVLLDSNGSNTTAAAAVRSAGRHLDLSGAEALVLGGTGPVGLRSAQILAIEGARVRIASRTMEKAESACHDVRVRVEGAVVTACEFSEAGLAAAVDGVQLIIAAGAAGVQFLTVDEWQSIDTLAVAIDLNAVPPTGLEGIDVTDQGTEKNGVACYGAIGVGGLKMKTHRRAVAQLFESNDQLLSTNDVYTISGQVD